MNRQFGNPALRIATGQYVSALLAAALTLGAACHASASDRGDDRDSYQYRHRLLRCDDSMKNEFRPDALTRVLLVKAYRKGEPLALSATPATPAPPTAANDVCVVKLVVGPGNPGPAGLPSTSPGIGIEVWLPSTANWNRRIHAIGGGGWAGGVHTDPTRPASQAQVALAVLRRRP
jgi:feruloyl esterase